MSMVFQSVFQRDINVGFLQVARIAFSGVKECFSNQESSANRRVYEMVSCSSIFRSRRRLKIEHSLVNLIPLAELQKDCIAQLYQFLAHQYPRVRTSKQINTARV